MSARWLSVHRLRLASALILVAFVVSHLLNHSVGLISLDALQRANVWFDALWGNWPATALLVVAAMTHNAIAYRTLYRLRSLSLPTWQWAQIVLGFLIPFWLVGHILATRILAERFGYDTDYAGFLLLAWPGGVPHQLILVSLVWGHAAIGLHYWLRLKPWYRRVQTSFAALALLLPVLAFTGFVSAGQQVALLRRDPTWVAEVRPYQGWPDQAVFATLAYESIIFLALVVLFLTVLAARSIRAWRNRASRVRVGYPSKTFTLERGVSLLDAARAEGVAHASVCGGRGRCSTCRVRVTAGRAQLPPADEGERQVLQRIGAPNDVRLACQLRPTHDLSATPLLPASASTRMANAPSDPAAGTEREMAVLFCDLRGFTRLAEGRLPYDTVFLLNQYFAVVGDAVEGAGGRIDKFIGDGVMALFGHNDSAPNPAAQALSATRAIGEAMTALNARLGGDLSDTLRLAVGLHAGRVIYGEMGFSTARGMTAIGDAVNVASRLEGLAKNHDAALVMSEAVAEAARIDTDGFTVDDITLRGRHQTLRVYRVANLLDLPGSGHQAERRARRTAEIG